MNGEWFVFLHDNENLYHKNRLHPSTEPRQCSLDIAHGKDGIYLKTIETIDEFNDFFVEEISGFEDSIFSIEHTYMNHQAFQGSPRSPGAGRFRCRTGSQQGTPKEDHDDRLFGQFVNESEFNKGKELKKGGFSPIDARDNRGKIIRVIVIFVDFKEKEEASKEKNKKNTKAVHYLLRKKVSKFWSGLRSDGKDLEIQEELIHLKLEKEKEDYDSRDDFLSDVLGKFLLNDDKKSESWNEHKLEKVLKWAKGGNETELGAIAIVHEGKRADKSSPLYPHNYRYNSKPLSEEFRSLKKKIKKSAEKLFSKKKYSKVDGNKKTEHFSFRYTIQDFYSLERGEYGTFNHEIGHMCFKFNDLYVYGDPFHGLSSLCEIASRAISRSDVTKTDLVWFYRSMKYLIIECNKIEKNLKDLTKELDFDKLKYNFEDDFDSRKLKDLKNPLQEEFHKIIRYFCKEANFVARRGRVTYERYGMWHWCLMACGDRCYNVKPCPYLQLIAGWIQPIVVLKGEDSSVTTRSETFKITPNLKTSVVLLHPEHKREGFFIYVAKVPKKKKKSKRLRTWKENERDYGVAILHFDESGSNEFWNGDELSRINNQHARRADCKKWGVDNSLRFLHPECQMMQADGNQKLFNDINHYVNTGDSQEYKGGRHNLFVPRSENRDRYLFSDVSPNPNIINSKWWNFEKKTGTRSSGITVEVISREKVFSFNVKIEWKCLRKITQQKKNPITRKAKKKRSKRKWGKYHGKK